MPKFIASYQPLFLSGTPLDTARVCPDSVPKIVASDSPYQISNCSGRGTTLISALQATLLEISLILVFLDTVFHALHCGDHIHALK